MKINLIETAGTVGRPERVSPEVNSRLLNANSHARNREFKPSSEISVGPAVSWSRSS
jgi:hypothetical protein